MATTEWVPVEQLWSFFHKFNTAGKPEIKGSRLLY